MVLERVRKTYAGGVEAVREFTLAVGDGEFVVLVGPSGCGKSTTLRIVAGLEEADSGTVSIGGRVVNDVAPKDRDLAMVFQNYALYPHMDVYRNMAFALKLRRVSREEIDRRVRHAAKILEIEGLLKRKPRELSGGQRQRVAVGRAIVREPKAFLFDEPLSNLDAKLRVTTRGELKALHQRLRTTTLYVTHDQEEAMTLGDRVVVMSGGAIQQVSTPLEAYRRPVNRFVAGFVGMPPMNFVEGRVEEGGSWFGSAAGRVRLPEGHAARLREGGVAGEAVLGVRPQAFEDGVGGGVVEMELRVGVVEPLGDRMDLSCEWGGGVKMVARVRATEGMRPGEVVKFGVDPSGLHVFERGEFGKNLTLGTGG